MTPTTIFTAGLPGFPDYCKNCREHRKMHGAGKSCPPRPPLVSIFTCSEPLAIFRDTAVVEVEWHGKFTETFGHYGVGWKRLALITWDTNILVQQLAGNHGGQQLVRPPDRDTFEVVLEFSQEGKL